MKRAACASAGEFQMRPRSNHTSRASGFARCSCTSVGFSSAASAARNDVGSSPIRIVQYRNRDTASPHPLHPLQFLDERRSLQAEECRRLATVAARALVSYHLSQQRTMMSAFLDKLGIAHEDGLISDETVTRPDAERLRAAAAELGASFPADDVSLYLATLVSQDPDTWSDLAEVPETRPAVSAT